MDGGRIAEVVERAAAARPERLALRLRTNGELRSCTYGELVKRFQAGARALRDAGLRPGDRMALLAENSPEWVVGYLSASAAGATVVPLDPGLPAEDLAPLLRAAEPRLLVVSKTSQAKLGDAAGALVVVPLETGLCAQAPAVPPLAPAAPDPDADPAIASILFTSGTSGRSKGVMLEHRSLLFASERAEVLWELNESEEMLLVLPLHHIYGFAAGLLGALRAGAGVTFVEAIRGDVMLAAMNETHTTMLPGVPRLFELLLQQIRRQVAARGKVAGLAFAAMGGATAAVRARSSYNPGPILFRAVFDKFGGRLRRLASGGAPLPLEVIEGMESLGFSLLQGYGLTETAAAATGCSYAERRPGTVGRAHVGCELKLFNPRATGEGEICIRGPSVMRGYFRDPETTAAVLRDGWFHTGDLGRLDERGYLTVLGRLDELIVTAAGKKAAPDDVERHYAGLPGVKELAVVGVRSGDAPGEQVHAAVVLEPQPGVAEAAARERVEEAMAARAGQIASHLRIQRVHFVREIPKTTKLSVKRKELRKLLEEEHDVAPRAEEREETLDELARAVVAVVAETSCTGQRVAPRLHASLQFDLGVDSLGRVELAEALAKRFGVRLDAQLPTLNRVVDLVEAVRAATADAAAEAGALSASPAAAQSPSPGTGGSSDGRGEGRGAAASSGTSPRVSRVPGPRGAVSLAIASTIAFVAKRLWRVEVEGLEHLPPGGPFVLCPNHQSNLDSIWVASAMPHRARRHMCSFAKQELFGSFVIRSLLKVAGAIPVPRDGDPQEALRAGVEVLRSGRALLVHPEGTRSKTGELGVFRRGAARMALEAGAPIIPARIVGAYDIYPPHRKVPRLLDRFPRRLELKIVFGAPIKPVAEGRSIEAEVELTERVRAAVEKLEPTARA